MLALTHSIVDNVPASLSCAIPQTLPFPTPKRVTILRRLTLHMNDPSQNHRIPALQQHYDLIAVRPTTEKMFLAACNDLSGFGIISLDLTIRHPFYFKPKPFSTAIARGIKFEISYSQALNGSAEQRRNFISNVQSIVRATRGRGLVLSSEAKRALGVRAPADVLNLMDIWGMAKDRAVQAIGENARSIVVNEKMTRTSFRGVVDVVYGGPAAEPRESQPKPKKGPKSKKGQTQADTPATSDDNGGKRKANDISKGDQGTMSKTKAKKMRLEALKMEKEKASMETSASGTEIPETAETITNG